MSTLLVVNGPKARERLQEWAAARGVTLAVPGGKLEAGAFDRIFVMQDMARYRPQYLLREWIISTLAPAKRRDDGEIRVVADESEVPE